MEVNNLNPSEESHASSPASPLAPAPAQSSPAGNKLFSTKLTDTTSSPSFSGAALSGWIKTNVLSPAQDRLRNVDVKPLVDRFRGVRSQIDFDASSQKNSAVSSTDSSDDIPSEPSPAPAAEEIIPNQAQGLLFGSSQGSFKSQCVAASGITDSLQPNVGEQPADSFPDPNLEAKVESITRGLEAQGERLSTLATTCDRVMFDMERG